MKNKALGRRILNVIPIAAGVCIVTAFLLFSLFPSVFAPFDPKEMFAPWQPPSVKHILGTNDLGYDIFSELIFAARNTILFGIISACIAVSAGTLIGVLAGMVKGVSGEFFNGIIQVVLMIPLLPFAIVITALCGASLWTEILIVGALGWSSSARITRNQTVKLMQSDFIAVLRAFDTPRPRIIICHLLPNLSEVIISRFLTSVTSFMLLEATMSFLGIGDVINPTWGTMASIAYRCGGFARGALNWLLPPCLCISLCVFAFWLIFTYFEKRSKRIEGIKK